MMTLFPHSCDESPNQPCLACCAIEAEAKAYCSTPESKEEVRVRPPSQCPDCGEWNCSHDDSTAPVRHFVDPYPEATQKREENTERLRKSLDGEPVEQRPSRLVPGWPFPTRKRA
jgi:hypothetical protein